MARVGVGGCQVRGASPTWSKRTGLSAIRPGWEGGSSSPARRGRPCFRRTHAGTVGRSGPWRSSAVPSSRAHLTSRSPPSGRWLEWEPDRFIDRITPRPLLIVTPGQWDVMHRFARDPGLCPCRRAQEDRSPGVRTDGRLPATMAEPGARVCRGLVPGVPLAGASGPQANWGPLIERS